MASRSKLLPYEKHLGKNILSLRFPCCILGDGGGQRYAVGRDFSVGVRPALRAFWRPRLNAICNMHSCILHFIHAYCPSYALHLRHNMQYGCSHSLGPRSWKNVRICEISTGRLCNIGVSLPHPTVHPHDRPAQLYCSRSETQAFESEPVSHLLQYVCIRTV